MSSEQTKEMGEGNEDKLRSKQVRQQSFLKKLRARKEKSKSTGFLAGKKIQTQGSPSSSHKSTPQSSGSNSPTLRRKSEKKGPLIPGDQQEPLHGKTSKSPLKVRMRRRRRAQRPQSSLGTSTVSSQAAARELHVRAAATRAFMQTRERRSVSISPTPGSGPFASTPVLPLELMKVPKYTEEEEHVDVPPGIRGRRISRSDDGKKIPRVQSKEEISMTSGMHSNVEKGQGSSATVNVLNTENRGEPIIQRFTFEGFVGLEVKSFCIGTLMKVCDIRSLIAERMELPPSSFAIYEVKKNGTEKILEQDEIPFKPSPQEKIRRRSSISFESPRFDKDAFSVHHSLVFSNRRFIVRKIKAPAASSTTLFRPPPLDAQVVAYICSYLEKEAFLLQGIFRVSGSKARQRALCTRFGEPDLELTGSDSRAHEVASALKLYLREQAEPIIPFDMYARFLGIGALSEEERTQRLTSYCHSLGEERKSVLFSVLELLQKIGAHAETNRMDVRNLASMFCPSILRCKDNIMDMTIVRKETFVVQTLIENASEIMVSKKKSKKKRNAKRRSRRIEKKGSLDGIPIHSVPTEETPSSAAEKNHEILHHEKEEEENSVNNSSDVEKVEPTFHQIGTESDQPGFGEIEKDIYPSQGLTKLSSHEDEKEGSDAPKEEEDLTLNYVEKPKKATNDPDQAPKTDQKQDLNETEISQASEPWSENQTQDDPNKNEKSDRITPKSTLEVNPDSSSALPLSSVASCSRVSQPKVCDVSESHNPLSNSKSEPTMSTLLENEMETSSSFTLADPEKVVIPTLREKIESSSKDEFAVPGSQTEENSADSSSTLKNSDWNSLATSRVHRIGRGRDPRIQHPKMLTRKNRTLSGSAGIVKESTTRRAFRFWNQKFDTSPDHDDVIDEHDQSHPVKK